MSTKKNKKGKDTFRDFDKSWEEEVERLKHDLKKAEKKIFRTDQSRFGDNSRFSKGCNRSEYPNMVDVHSSPVAEKLTHTRKLPCSSSETQRELRNVQTEELPNANWVSPTVSKIRPPNYEDFDPFLNCLESSLDIDCGSSVISLDFGLISPKKTWCSPPQRIERAQNREWSSPHRVIDRPSPENSPGNWISMKESCFPLRHSPMLDVKAHPVQSLACPQPSDVRPLSQATYVVPDSVRSPEEKQPKRKISVLGDFEPERVVTTKKKTAGPPDAVEVNLLTTNDKIRRIVEPSGHVIKISLLEDFEAPAFGKTHEKPTERADKEGGEPSEKTARGCGSKITKISSKLSPPALKPQIKKRKEEPKEEGGTCTRDQSTDRTGKQAEKIIKEEKANVEEESEIKADDISKSTQKMIQDLENILKNPSEDCDQAVSFPEKENNKEEIPKPIKNYKTSSKPPEEKPGEKENEKSEKRKRNVDPKAVQEFIKSQKQKRIEKVKIEKKTKDAEKEARKKKLEELRIKTLQLAAQSKKKKAPEPPPQKVIDPNTEDEITVSLGLKHVKPKVSYNESVLKLKKKTTQQKLQLDEGSSQQNEPQDEEDDEKTLENLEKIPKTEPEDLKKPEETIELQTSNDLNDTLKKLVQTLHLKLDEKEKQMRSRPPSLASKSTKDPLSQVPSQETIRTVKSAPEDNRQMVSVDLETIQTLKSDIKKISENFKVLHEIIIDKAELSGRKTFVSKSAKLNKAGKSTKPAESSKPLELNKPEESSKPLEIYNPEKSNKATTLNKPAELKISDWLKGVVPQAYPYNVFSALQKKINMKMTKTSSSISQESSTFAEPLSNKYDSEFEALSMPSDRLRSVKDFMCSLKSTSVGTSEENYFSVKDDSGSELSSSILDSEKQSNSRRFSSSKGTRTSSIITEISSKSMQLAKFDSVTSNSCRSSRENLILVTPDIKLISNDLHQEKLNNVMKNLNVQPEELNNSDKSHKEQKTDSTVTELIDNLSENDKSVKSVNEKPQNVIQRIEEVHMRRSFFQPEMLHLQFQAELTLLETFQQSLSHFLEAERMKTLTEVNKIVYEKGINTEKLIQKEDQAVQTSYLKETSEKTTSEETNSVKTEINVDEESIKSEVLQSPKEVVTETSEKHSTSSKETIRDEKEIFPKDLETSDHSSSHAGISFQMLNRMMKDEELRSEHQLVLIRLREKTLNEKVKAELTFLEMKKRALKERAGDEEQNISAIKKKQRGILLKYQSEKEEIERLKKMHKIASEERKIMIKQQKQLQQMQMSTNDIIIKLKKREKSPQKKLPLKPKALKSSDSLSEIPENIPIVSDSVLSDSVCSRHSTHTDLDLSSRSSISEDDSEIPKRKSVYTSYSLENFKSKKSQLELEKYPRKRHSVEELLSWTRRLEEKENHLKELEKQTNKANSKLKKSLKSCMKDRSTSPFQFPESKTISEVSPPVTGTETKKSSTITEIVETTPKTETTLKTESVVEKVQSSASEDIPEQFSKKVSTSRTEYYSESFESPSSSETPKNKPEVVRTKSASTEWGQKGISIKLSLSPRMQSPRRRYSSGSDESVNLSHTETASEQSDLETRIAALHEQLRKRKLEAERLRREQKKVQRERLKVKEQSLLKQIQAYDEYIQKKKQELEQEYENSHQTIMKPLIKQPKVAEKAKVKRLEPLMTHEADKFGLSPKLEPMKEEKDEISEKVPESDSEVVEQIMSEKSDSVISSKIEEEEEEEMVVEDEDKSKTTEPVENSIKESFDVVKLSSASESLPEQDVLEGSQSESEDQSVSVKTTLHSTEKQDSDIINTPTEEESQNKQTIDEDVYQLDSFESDAEEKQTESENVQQESEAATEIKTGSTCSEKIEEAKSEDESLKIEAIEENQERSETAETIADSIIMELILESLNVFSCKKAEAEKKLAEKSKLNLEELSSYLAKEIIAEAVDDMIGIYNRKDERIVSSDRITTEVRKKFREMMPCRQQDVPTAISTKESAESGEQSPLQLPTPFTRDKKAQVQSFTEGKETIIEEPKPETFDQEWSGDEFNLSRTRREAEELRLQQLQIEQEIQQLQAQQEQVPYFYLREIPNKPPPPYTPPYTNHRKPLAEIPTSESDVMNIAVNAVKILTEEMSKGKRIAEVEPTWEYYGEAVSENLKCYKLFLFDLAKHLISNLIEQQEKKAEVLPWMRTRESLSKYKYQKIDRTFECLNDFVQKQVSILFGFGRKVSKESLIVRWIKKKRDHVDEILVGESQEEEAQWTQYDEDQIAVKNEVTIAILDGLLEDTTRVVNTIFLNKLKREKSK